MIDNLTGSRARAVISRQTLAVALFLVLSGCGSSTADLQEFVNTAYQDRRPEIEPLPPIEPYVNFVYSAENDGSPFSLGNIVSDNRGSNVVSGERPDENRRKEPLEQFPLDALKLVGTLIQQDTPWVIVESADGTAHRATIGNYMGRNDGKIKEIVPIEKKIVLAELVLDASGRWITRDLEITIDE